MALAFVCGPMLEINVDAGPTLRFPLEPDARFSVTYWHSMYDAPVTESFVVTETELRLMTVRSSSPKVLEYLELDGAVDTDLPIERRFGAIAFRVATREPQVLAIGAHKRSFREFGGPGTRVVFVPANSCAAPSAAGK